MAEGAAPPLVDGDDPAAQLAAVALVSWLPCPSCDETHHRALLHCGVVPAVLYSADVVCPMTGPPLADGGVLVVDGRIVAVDGADSLRSRADREHHVDGVLLPGLVNAHTHLEHHDAAEPLARPGPHHLWVRAVDGLTGTWSPERWARSARRGVQRSLRAGVTCVTDVVTRGPAVPAASRAGLLGDSLVEIAFVDHREADDVAAALRVSLDRPAAGRRVGIAARGPWAVSAGVLQTLGALAAEHDRPLRIAAAESNAEVAAIRTAEGPLADLARELRLQLEWLDGGAHASPVGYLDQLGLLRSGVSLAHGVWVDLADARRLAASAVPVVLCPRVAATLKMGDAPLERYAETGTPLALGTGSPAAVGDLDVLADAAAWVELARRRELVYWPSAAGPVSLEEQAVRLATVDGARTLGWGSAAGVLEPGRRADLVGVAVATTVERVYADLVAHGPGRQVLTVLEGVRRARRADPDEPWPEVEEHKDL